MYWSPNVLAVVFKNLEISQQAVTRMQDLGSEFSKIFMGGDTPGPSKRERETLSRTQHSAWPLAGRGAQASWCWDPNLGPPQLFSRGCAPALVWRMWLAGCRIVLPATGRPIQGVL